MKKLYILTIALLMSAVAVFANSPEPENFDAVKKTLISNLKMDNAGVRNSTLHVIAKIRSEYPNADMSDLNGALVRMARNDKVSHLRASANLTFAYINNANLVSKVENVDVDDPALFFSELYTQVNADFFNFAD